MPQPTLTVLDALGAPVTIFTANPNGQALAAGSVPVVFTLLQAPVTDTQLRAAPVIVSGPLTDTQLRTTPVPVSPSSPNAAVDRSGSITTGGTAQSLMSAAASRRGFALQNLSLTTDLWVNYTATASAAAGSIKLLPSALYETPTGLPATAAVSVFSTLTGHTFTAKEW